MKIGDKAVLVASIALLVIVIQVVSCGGIGLDIAPEKIEVEPDSAITYNITVYNYQDHLDCFDITVIPESCDAIWFDWWHFGGWWHEEFICISRNEQKQVSLKVTPNVEGEFNFLVKTVSASNPGVEASQGVQITVKGPNQPPVNPTLTPDKPEPQPAGTAIEWTASAKDPDGDELYYRFWIKGPATGNTWMVMQNWSINNTWTWDTSDTDVGDTDISVWIRDGHIGYIEKKYYGYTIVEVENKKPCYGILVPTRTELQNAGTRITWVAYAEDPEEDTRYYRFWIKGPATDNSWQIKQDWSTNNIWVWNTTATDIGNTDISVWIRDGYHTPTNKYDLEKKVYSYGVDG